jgi:hypothetical protein
LEGEGGKGREGEVRIGRSLQSAPVDRINIVMDRYENHVAYLRLAEGLGEEGRGTSKPIRRELRMRRLEGRHCPDLSTKASRGSDMVRPEGTSSIGAPRRL